MVGRNRYSRRSGRDKGKKKGEDRVKTRKKNQDWVCFQVGGINSVQTQGTISTVRSEQFLKERCSLTCLMENRESMLGGNKKAEKRC